METKLRTHPTMTVSISFDSVLGVGGGMVLISLAQYLPEGNTFKTLLVMLAPPITMFFKYVCEICSPEINESIRIFRTTRESKGLLKRIDECLKDPGLSGNARLSLMKHRETVKLFVVYNRMERLESLMKPGE